MIRLIQAIIDLQVTTNPEFVKNHLGLRETWCNKFAQMWLALLGITVPAGMLINNMIDWFMSKPAFDDGWRQCSPSEALLKVASGAAVVVVWKNPGKDEFGKPLHGHIAVCREVVNGAIVIAQAGGENFESGSIARGFGNLASKVMYFTHPVV